MHLVYARVPCLSLPPPIYAPLHPRNYPRAPRAPCYSMAWYILTERSPSSSPVVDGSSCVGALSVESRKRKRVEGALASTALQWSLLCSAREIALALEKDEYSYKSGLMVWTPTPPPFANERWTLFDLFHLPVYLTCTLNPQYKSPNLALIRHYFSFFVFFLFYFYFY